MLEDVVSAVKSRGLTEKAIIISFDMEHLKAVYELEPSIELWYLIDEITPENIAQAKALGGKVWLSANFEKNTAECISLAMSENINFSLWTVNTAEDAKMLYDMGIRYMETDILCN